MSGPTIRIIPYGDPASSTKTNPSTVLEALRLIKVVASGSGAGVLYGLTVTNTGPAQFLHLYDSAAAPTNGAVPVFSVYLPTSSSLSVDFGAYGLPFFLGMYVGNSGTVLTRTAGAADCAFFARFQ